MRRIAIFGGAFDPVTKGHVTTAQYILEHTDVNEVWLMPCSTHRYGKPMQPFEHRMAMLKLALENHENIQACGYEGENKLPGDTYSLIKALKKDPKYKSYQFRFVVGIDNANNIEKWYRWEELITMVPFIVISRAGSGAYPEIDWYKKEPHIDLSNVKWEGRSPISSTMARIAIFEGEHKEMERLLPPAVVTYIINEKLYGYKL
jgi:nicotinate-nucleotide adenylyltransferase